VPTSRQCRIRIGERSPRLVVAVLGCLVILTAAAAATSCSSTASSSVSGGATQTATDWTNAGLPGWDSAAIDPAAKGFRSMSKISCPTSTFCMAVTWHGDSYRFVHGMWLKAQQVVTSGSDRLLQAVSCPTASFCMAVGDNHEAYGYSNGQWSAGSVISRGSLASVSCPSSTHCIASDNLGGVTTYVDGSWSQSISVDPGTTADPVTGSIVSCPSTSFCAAVDGNGAAFIYSDGSWSSPQQIDVNTGSSVEPTNIMLALSCPSSSFCMAVDQGGNAFTYSNGGWTQSSLSFPPNVTATGTLLNDVSCPTSNNCLVTSPQGYVFSYSQGEWGVGQKLNNSNGLRSISCPIVGFCIADSTGGESFRFTGSVAATPPTTAPSIPAVESCTNQPGDTVERPPMIAFGCGATNASVQNISWSSWSNTQALGIGTYTANTCVPDCAQGSSASEQAQVVLTRPGTYLGSVVFQAIVVTPVGGAQPVQSVTGEAGSGWGAL